MILLSGAAATCSAQSGDQMYTATRQQLDSIKVVLAQQSAWNRGDLDAYLGYYRDAPDTEAILAAPVRGLPNIRGAFRANFASHEAMGSLEYSQVEAREMGTDYTLVQGHYRIERARKAGGDIEGTFTDILQKTPQGWRLIFSQAT
jgi:ketosteroid isomerase-like protein